MPILVLNMAGEMLYVLSQRLAAHKVPHGKARQVLSEIMSALFSTGFLEELLKPQPVFSTAAMRQVVERLAHSSVMRLNHSSMNKLYDLIAMAVKQQTLSCRHAKDLLLLTTNHLGELRRMCADVDTTARLDLALERIQGVYAPFRISDWVLVRQLLLRFFQPETVKVSLFLQLGTQLMNSVFVLTNGGMLAEGGRSPGAILYPQTKLEKTFKAQQSASSAFSAEDENLFPIGRNAFAEGAFGKGSNEAGPSIKPSTVEEPPLFSADDSRSSAQRCSSEQRTSTGIGHTKEAVTGAGLGIDEMSLLSELTGSGKDWPSSRTPFSVDLFHDDPRGSDIRPGGAIEAERSWVGLDAAGEHKTMTALLGDFKLDNDGEGAKCADDKTGARGSGAFDSLLDLMDTGK